jgi:hypothetical protein
LGTSERGAGFGRDLLRLLADTRTRRGLGEVIRLARRIKLFGKALLLLLLLLPIHGSSPSKPRIIHGEIQASDTEQQGDESKPENQQVPAPRSLLGLLQLQLFFAKFSLERCVVTHRHPPAMRQGRV